MARVTVEDCITRVPNRFELVLIASQRVNEIATGAPLAVDRDNDKNSVIALREIAEDKVSLDALKEDLVRAFQIHHEDDADEREAVEALSQEKDWLEQNESGNIEEEIAEDALTVVEDIDTPEALEDADITDEDLSYLEDAEIH